MTSCTNHKQLKLNNLREKTRWWEENQDWEIKRQDAGKRDKMWDWETKWQKEKQDFEKGTNGHNSQTDLVHKLVHGPNLHGEKQHNLILAYPMVKPDPITYILTYGRQIISFP